MMSVLLTQFALAQFTLAQGQPTNTRTDVAMGPAIVRTTITALVPSTTITFGSGLHFAEITLDAARVTPHPLREKTSGVLASLGDTDSTITLSRPATLVLTYYTERTGDIAGAQAHADHSWLPRGMQAYAKALTLMKAHASWQEVAELFGEDDSTGVLTQLRSHFPNNECLSEPRAIEGPHDPAATWYQHYLWSEPPDLCPWWKVLWRRLAKWAP